MRRLLLVLFVSFSALAAPPPSITITAEGLTDGPVPKRVATTVTGQVEFTPDGKQLLFIDADGLKALPVKGPAKPRALISRAGSFRVSPDSRIAVARGEPFSRVALEGKSTLTTLGKGQIAHTLSGQALSSTWFVFVNEAGELVRTELATDVTTPFTLEPPKDKNVHAGVAYPRGFSTNGEWLLFQHGSNFEVMRPDGTKRSALDLVDAQLSGNRVLGTARDAQVTSLVVVDLISGKRTKVANTRLFTLARMVGDDTLLQVDAQGKLVKVDLKKGMSSVLFEAANGAVSPSIGISPDGKSAVLCVKRKGGNDVFRLELATGKRQRVAQLEGSDQCFAETVSAQTALVYAWVLNDLTADAVLLSVNLESGAVQRLGPSMKSIGNLVVAPGVAAVNAGPDLFLSSF